MTGITDLVTQLSNEQGVARANRVEVWCPARITDWELMDTTVTTINLPERNIMTGEYFHHEQQKSFVYGYTNNDITLTIRGTNSWKIYESFYNWMETVLNSNDYTLGYKSGGYGADFWIAPMDATGKRTCHFKLINAYPKSLGQITMGNDNDQIVTFTVTILYDRFEFENVN